LSIKNDWAQNKEEYRKFCRLTDKLPIFFQDWWLDVVCGQQQWNVCLAKDKGGAIQGILPFYQSRSYGMKVIVMPPLTPYLGVWLNYTNHLDQKSNVFRFEKKVVNKLIDQLPSSVYYAQRHPVDFKNSLPFHFKGFKQATHFTFIIPKGKTIKTVWLSIDSSVRNKIRKAEAADVQIEKSDDVDLFYKINKKSFDRQSLKMPYSLAFIKNLNNALKLKEQGQIFLARDSKNNIHAAIYLIWDDDTIYNLMLGADTQLRNSGAVQLLLWTGIQKAIQENKNFDFEGGMMPNIVSIFSGFGSKLMPYHKIYKGGDFIFRLISSLKNG